MKKSAEMKSKSANKEIAVAEVIASSKKASARVAVRAVESPPSKEVPAVPAGFEEPGRAVMSRYHKPTEAQRPGATSVADELLAAREYTGDFTANAPPASALAGALAVAASWDAVYDEARAFADYALAMRASAWDAALRPLARLQTRFDAAVSDDPKVAKRYPKLAAFLGARGESAVRAAFTRKENKKRAKEAAAKAAAATVSSATQH